MSGQVIPFRPRAARRPPAPPGRLPRQGVALAIVVEGEQVVLLADSMRIELSPLQAVEVARDLQELAADATGDFCDRVEAALSGTAPPPPTMNGPEARARLRLLAETLDAMDRGDKRASDVVWLARQLTSEVRRG